MVRGDTIAAVATAPGRGGVAIVRVSGPDAFEIAKRLTGENEELKMRNEEWEGLCPLAFHSSLIDRETVIDDGLVLCFKAPRSYTGEDVVEFQCHGGAVTPRRVLEACFAAGARLARRGEFTERAFLNGKLDYDQAESVLDLVDAKTGRAADAALEGLAGRKARVCRELYDRALALSAELEHALDVDEGELPEEFYSSVNSQLLTLHSQLIQIIRRAREGRLLRNGALVVLAGPPNAGKSSLMNALLEENRAIVSDVPGTTRDAIEEWLDLGGWPIRLVDTAGLRDTGDQVEAEGVRRAEALVARADVVVALAPAGQVPSGSLGQSLPARELAPTAIAVTSKCDLERGAGLNVSAVTGEGLDELKAAIVARLEAAAAGADEGPGYDDERLAVLTEVAARLTAHGGRLTGEADLVLVGNEVRSAAERLGALVGATYSSDLLERLFSRFCVGK